MAESEGWRGTPRTLEEALACIELIGQANSQLKDRESVLMRELDDARRVSSRPEGGAERGPKRDLSLQALIKPWAGDATSRPLADFLQEVEMVASSGHWTEQDKGLICRMKLSGPALDCMSGRPELAEGSDFETLKTILKSRFDEERSPSDAMGDLYALKQEGGETVKAYSERCVKVGARAVRYKGQDAKTEWEKEYVDQLVLAAFVKGLKGEARKVLTFSPPNDIKEAVRVATRVERHEKEEHLSRARPVYLTTESSVTHMEPRAPDQDLGVRASRETAGRTNNNLPRPPADEGRPPEVLCYQCGGRGHLARECPSRLRGSKRTDSPGRCFRCQGKGHFARECREPLPNKPAPNAQGLRDPPPSGPPY